MRSYTAITRDRTAIATMIIEIIIEIIVTTITTAKSSPTESSLSSQTKLIPIAFEEELGLH